MAKQCQSCAMPLSKCPQGGGSEADGSKSSKYCSHCYQHGAFTQPDMTAQEMQEFVIGMMREQGWPRALGWLLTRGIPRLERWRMLP
jgi:hypothetical protein